MNDKEKSLQQLIDEIEQERELAPLQSQDALMQQIGATPDARKKFYSACNKHKIAIDVRIGILSKIIQYIDLERILSGYPTFEDRLDCLKRINKLANKLIELQAKRQNENIRQDRLSQQLENKIKNLIELLESIKGDMNCLSNWLFITDSDLKKWLANPLDYVQQIADRTDAAINTYSQKGHKPGQHRRWFAGYIHDIFVLCCYITPTTTMSGPFVEILAATYYLLLSDETKAYQLAFDDARERIQVRKRRTELTS